MARTIDTIFAVLLLVGAALHAYGTFAGYAPGTEVFVWSLAGSLAAGLVAVLNLLRVRRPEDWPLAWICLVSSLCWTGLALAFGAAIGNVVDPRALWHVIVGLVLAGFSLRTLMGRG